MFNDLFNNLTEGNKDTAKEIKNSPEWGKFSFKVTEEKKPEATPEVK